MKALKMWPCPWEKRSCHQEEFHVESEWRATKVGNTKKSSSSKLID